MHGVEVDPVARGVHEHIAVRDLFGESGARVGRPHLRTGPPPVLAGDGLRALLVDIEEEQAGHFLRLGEVSDDRGGDRAAGSQHGDVHPTSSRAFSASQNSMRSRAIDRSRPVSCSIRRMR